MLRSVITLCSLLFLVSLCTAETEVINGIEWTYTVSNGKASIGHKNPYTSAEPAIPQSTVGTLVIPSILGGCPVTSIRAYAFSGCSGLTGNLVIPEGVTTIGGYAFSGCSGLTGNLVIPKGVRTIEQGAFCNCSGLTGSLVIPEGVTTIEQLAFYGCSGLTGDVVIPKGVRTIGNNALKDTAFQKAICLGAPPSGWDIAGTSLIVSFPQEYARQWNSILSSSLRGTVLDAISFADVTVIAEMTTPKTIKVTYTIHSNKRDKARVYALAFEDGERSFAKVLPVKTATADSPEAVPNGNEVATNTPHTFIWNVLADWDTDLSKVMVEILVMEGDLLSMELLTIPANGSHAEMTISTNTQTETSLFNALLWCYASGDPVLKNKDGFVTVGDILIAKYGCLPTNYYDWDSWETSTSALLNYLYGKMGYKILSGNDLTYANQMTRLDIPSSGLSQRAIKIVTTSEE